MNSKEHLFIRLTVYGLVQGVGFRPYTACLCEDLGIRGFVKNTGGSVEILAAGTLETLKEFEERICSAEREGLPGARVSLVKKEEIDKETFDCLCRFPDRFTIESSDDKGALSEIPADIGICGNCREELLSEKNRRYRHPFISCVSCGPRFSIMKSLPYDRENTTMDGFPLCSSCKKEYEKSPFRRYAQTIACNSCGPQLKAYIKKDGRIVCAGRGSDALELAVRYIRDGGICAVKNVGGYHFTFDAFNDETAGRLRKIKARENKPFAVMFPDVETVKYFCRVSDREKRLLCSDVRPIVLLEKNKDKKISEWNGKTGGKKAEGGLWDNLGLSGSVCKKSILIGAMLPCDAVQILLSLEFSALVMTSANLNSEPIVKDDEKALEFLENGHTDIVLANDREILRSMDDSIFQVIKTENGELVQVIRRARGLVPKSIGVNRDFNNSAFAAGGDLKAVFGIGIGNSVILSGHYGDLDDPAAFDLWREDKKNYEKILGAASERSVCDMHPGYHSVRESEKEGPGIFRVQHHYAHIMSVAAEHKLNGKLLGLALDGTGYGTDGRIWGSELLICDPDDPGSFKRAGHFEEIKLTGGESAVRNADITAMCFVYEGIRRGYITPSENPYAEDERYGVIVKALENNVNTLYSTSAGRLFDALSAALDICHINSYEGECPVLLQQQAEDSFLRETGDCQQNKRSDGTVLSGEDKGHGSGNRIVRCGIRQEEEVFLVESIGLFCDILKLKKSGCPVKTVSLIFHEALTNALIEQLVSVREDTGINAVALSGGVFSNALLLRLVYDGLISRDFKVYVNELVPPNDGGLALGQLYGCSLR